MKHPTCAPLLRRAGNEPDSHFAAGHLQITVFEMFANCIREVYICISPPLAGERHEVWEAWGTAKMSVEPLRYFLG
jgi:hypothetical protein